MGNRDKLNAVPSLKRDRERVLKPAIGHPQVARNCLEHQKDHCSASAARRKVLVLEPNIAETLVQIFINAGYDARGAGSLTGAVNLTEQWSPDLTIIDAACADIPQFETMRTLVRSFPCSRLLVLSRQMDISDSLDATVVHELSLEIIEKPVLVKHLLDRAENMVPR